MDDFSSKKNWKKLDSRSRFQLQKVSEDTKLEAIIKASTVMSDQSRAELEALGVTVRFETGVIFTAEFPASILMELLNLDWIVKVELGSPLYSD